MKTINKKHILAGLLMAAAVVPVETLCTCPEKEILNHYKLLVPSVLKIISYQFKNTPLWNLPWTQRFLAFREFNKFEKHIRTIGCHSCSNVTQCLVPTMAHDLDNSLNFGGEKTKKLHENIVSGTYISGLKKKE